jgi:hypothetical protein
MEILKKVVTLTNPAREFEFVSCLGRLMNLINIPILINSNWLITSNMSYSGWKFAPLIIFILLNLPFLLIHMGTNFIDFNRIRRRKGRRCNK